MPSAILGKRTRNVGEEADSPAILTRSKRRLVINSPNDENENPFIHHDDASEEEDLVSDPKREKQTRRNASTPTVPSKHGAPGQRVALSPSKIDGVFRVTKPTSVVKEGKKQSRQASTSPRTVVPSAEKIPVTPRHRVRIAGGRIHPGTPKTPGTPSQSVYNPVRQLFSRCCAPGRLVGREQERDELTSFINTRLDSTSSGCLYISGPPGTGKSALIDEVVRSFQERAGLGLSVVNCMSVRSTKDLSVKLTEDLGLEGSGGFENLRSCFSRSKPEQSEAQFLVILDEVDRLVDLDLSLLYSLFEWSMQDNSRLILIGIANALDLTDRFLPRLKSRNLKPELLPFMPYTAAQISDVLTSKLKSLVPADSSVLPFLHPAAIQFCAKKVASQQTGDLRKAFDICRRAIDLIEAETREKDAEAAFQNSPSKTALIENINLSSPTTPRSPAKSTRPMSLSTYSATTAPKATIAHIAKVTAQVFSNGTTQRLHTLNLHQKAVLCALSALETHTRNTASQSSDPFIPTTPSSKSHLTTSSAPTLKKLYETYTTLCKHDNQLQALSSVEFRDVVSGLETLSLISFTDNSGSGRGSSASGTSGLGTSVPLTPSRTPGRRPKNGFGYRATGDERRVAGICGQLELRAVLQGSGGELLRGILEGRGI